MEKMIFCVLGVFCAATMILLMTVLVVYLPATLTSEERCLSAGYPKTKVTWNLNAYCTTLDGAVTVKVVKQK